MQADLRRRELDALDRKFVREQVELLDRDGECVESDERGTALVDEFNTGERG